MTHTTTIYPPNQTPVVVTTVQGEVDPNETWEESWERHVGRVIDKLKELGM